MSANEEGRFAIDGVSHEACRLYAYDAPARRASSEREVALRPNASAAVDLVIGAAGGIELVIAGPDGMPTCGAIATCASASGTEFLLDRVLDGSRDDLRRARCLPPGRYVVEVSGGGSADGAPAGRREVEVREGATERIEITLP